MFLGFFAKYLSNYGIFLFVDKIVGLEEVWFLGDNFAATTYCKYFLNKSTSYELAAGIEFEDFICKNFEFNMFCNSCFISSMKNMLTRIQNTMVGAINKHISLPKYLLVVLDDDIITYLDYKGVGASELLDNWIQWIMSELESLIQKRKDQLPLKAKKEGHPFIYWSMAPTHKNFSSQRNDLRKKMNFCLESILKGKSGMRILKLKEWEFS